MKENVPSRWSRFIGLCSAADETGRESRSVAVIRPFRSGHVLKNTFFVLFHSGFPHPSHKIQDIDENKSNGPKKKEIV